MLLFNGIDDDFFSFFNRGLELNNNIGSHSWKSLDDKYVLRVNAPGFTEDNVKVNVLPYGNYHKINVSGNVDENDEYGFKNKSSFAFEEYLLNVDTEKIKANIKNGVLTVVVPKIKHEKELKQGQEIKVLPG